MWRKQRFWKPLLLVKSLGSISAALSVGGAPADFPNSGLYKLSLVNAFAACCLNRESSIIQLQILQTDLSTFSLKNELREFDERFKHFPLVIIL